MKILLFLITGALSMSSGAHTLSEFRDVLKAGDAVQLAALLQQADEPLPKGSRDETLLHTAT